MRCFCSARLISYQMTGSPFFGLRRFQTAACSSRGALAIVRRSASFGITPCAMCSSIGGWMLARSLSLRIVRVGRASVAEIASTFQPAASSRSIARHWSTGDRGARTTFSMIAAMAWSLMLPSATRTVIVAKSLAIAPLTRRSPTTISSPAGVSFTTGGWMIPTTLMAAAICSSATGLAALRRGLSGLTTRVRGSTVLSSMARCSSGSGLPAWGDLSPGRGAGRRAPWPASGPARRRTRPAAAGCGPAVAGVRACRPWSGSGDRRVAPPSARCRVALRPGRTGRPGADGQPGWKRPDPSCDALVQGRRRSGGRLAVGPGRAAAARAAWTRICSSRSTSTKVQVGSPTGQCPNVCSRKRTLPRRSAKKCS